MISIMIILFLLQTLFLVYIIDFAIRFAIFINILFRYSSRTLTAFSTTFYAVNPNYLETISTHQEKIKFILYVYLRLSTAALSIASPLV